MKEVKKGDYVLYKEGSRIIIDKVIEIDASKFYTETGYNFIYHDRTKWVCVTNEEAKNLLENKIKQLENIAEIHKFQLENLKN